MNNNWNEVIYKLWSPVYDRIFNSGHFLKARKQLFQEIKFDRNQKILFVGVGTGADLELLNHQELNLTAIDYSNEMLEVAKAKFSDSSIEFLKMDALNMSFQSNEFDRVVASLVLSVVPDADKCLKEMTRVLKEDGVIIIFDKFTPKGKELSPFKKIVRPLIKLLGTDIGVNFEKLYQGNMNDLELQEDTPILFNGMYRKIIVRKK